MKNKDLGRIIFIIFGFISLMTVMFIVNINDPKVLLIMLPLVYGLLYIGISKIHHYLNYPGMFTLNIIVFIRLVVIPILILVYPSYLDTYNMFPEAILFMIFEAVSLGVLLIFLTRNSYQFSNIEEKNYFSYDKNIIIKIVTVLAIFTVIMDPRILLQYNFAFTDIDGLELIKGRSLVTGIQGLIVDWGKIFLPLLLTLPLINRYKKNKKKIYYYTTIVIILFFNVFIFSGTSRSSMLIPAVSSIFYLINAFPYKRKSIFKFMSVVIFIVVIQLTLLKSEYTGNKLGFSLTEIINYLEAYFVGPKNLGIAIKAKEIYGGFYTNETFFNDMFSNFPGLSKFFDLENRTNTLYNLAYYHGGAQRDQIIPSIGQGFFYFGYIFSFLPQMLIVIGMAKLDSFYSKTRDMVGLYIYAYFAVKFGFTYAQSLASNLSFLYSLIIPVTVIYILDTKVNGLIRGRRYPIEEDQNTVCNK